MTNKTKAKKFHCKIKIVAVLCLSLFILKTGMVIASADSKTMKKDYIEVVVTKGDTLWNLATKHGSPKKDPRLIIYHIQNLNELKPTEHIQPGQILVIPKE